MPAGIGGKRAQVLLALESGAFDEIPKTQLVVTTLAFGGVLLAGGFGDGSTLPVFDTSVGKLGAVI